MAQMNPYLNFDGKAEEAFNFYKSVFGGEFSAVHRMTDAPEADQLPENERGRIMHIALPIDEHTVLMASDILPSCGHVMNKGNNVQLSLHPVSREEADHLFNGLSADGVIEMPMANTFWGAYFGSFKDKYGIGWMINFELKQQQ